MSSKSALSQAYSSKEQSKTAEEMCNETLERSDKRGDGPGIM